MSIVSKTVSEKNLCPHCKVHCERMTPDETTIEWPAGTERLMYCGRCKAAVSQARRPADLVNRVWFSKTQELIRRMESAQIALKTRSLIPEEDKLFARCVLSDEDLRTMSAFSLTMRTDPFTQELPVHDIQKPADMPPSEWVHLTHEKIARYLRAVQDPTGAKRTALERFSNLAAAAITAQAQ